MTNEDRTAFPAASAMTRFWLIGFVLLLIVCQIGLLFEFLAPVRVVFRTAAFAVSLLALLLVPGVARRHPSWPFLGVALAVVVLGLFHPSTNSPLAAIALIALYLAIAAPLLWVTRLSVTPADLVRVFGLVWAFHTFSAFFGVLQTLFPGKFQPAVSEVIRGMESISEGLKITLADGNEVWRPMGLTDQPGGASTAGVYAIFFGMGFVSIGRHWVVRLTASLGMAIGMYCVYLSQIRVAVIISALMAVVYLVTLVWMRRGWDAARLLLVLVLAGSVSFAAAVAIGGESVTGRLSTLVEERPDEVYYKNRGRFLEETLTEHLPDYPLGAGLGRWGMIRYYFADETNPNSPPIWSEIQWTAWVLDGGVPLTLAYTGAILAALWATARIAIRTPDRWLAGWAALIAAYDVAVCATTFGYIPFIGQPGMEFWFLNAAITATAVSRRTKTP